VQQPLAEGDQRVRHRLGGRVQATIDRLDVGLDVGGDHREEQFFLRGKIAVKGGFRPADAGADFTHRGAFVAQFAKGLGGDVEDRLTAGRTFGAHGGSRSLIRFIQPMCSVLLDNAALSI